jgi:molecular chaperone DnaK (HSP70)
LAQRLHAMNPPRFAIGIDLGTTNCVLAWVDLRVNPVCCEVFAVPQVSALDSVVRSALLPSFCYFATAAEAAAHQFDPFAGESDERAPFVVGQFAREQMNTLPGRVIHSAKSWLAHAGIDREANILPYASDEISASERLSPVAASAAYLAYLREAWDHNFARDDADNAFVRQRIVVTVPASFDESAQSLTRKAAELAGYPRGLRLLEEPQAAFYAWLDGHDDGATAATRLLALLPELTEFPRTVLVCDIGGGTSDFSLFRIAPLTARQALPQIERIATSDHLLLGGDNIDLALAHELEQQLKPADAERLSRRQWSHLVPHARLLKERILTGDVSEAELFHVSVPGAGASLFQSALSTTISAARVRQLVLDGFFPLSAANERPRARQGGLREMGLPYAADSAISRHLAAFLEGQIMDGVDAVLFAGGSLRPVYLQKRLLALLEAWQGRPPALLALADMSLAIAQGAARFGAILASAGGQGRIRGGYPRSVYLELHQAQAGKAPDLVCVLPQGSDEGSKIELATPVFNLLLNRPVRFTVYTSHSRAADRPGDVVALSAGAFHPLPPLHTALVLEDANFNPRKSAQQGITVQIEAELTELGVLQTALRNAERGERWQLEFNLRKPVGAATDVDVSAARPDHLAVPAEAVAAASDRIALFYGKKQSLGEKDNVKTLARELERLLGQERGSWSVPLLRALWAPLHPGITRRGRSLDHENTWLYLAGFVLRPGYGSELDPWRMIQLWECFELGLAHRKEKSAQANWWMLWRRTAGGLAAEQQEQLWAAALPQTRKAAGEFVEGTRLLGTLERVALAERIGLTELLLDQILKGKVAAQSHVFWTLGRLLGRLPLYTASETVLPAAVVEAAFTRVAALDWRKLGLQALVPVFSAACRLTGERSLDIHDEVRGRVIDKLQRAGASVEQLLSVQEYQEVSVADRNQLFGEELPAGLSLAGSATTDSD